MFSQFSLFHFIYHLTNKLLTILNDQSHLCSRSELMRCWVELYGMKDVNFFWILFIQFSLFRSIYRLINKLLTIILFVYPI